MTFVNAYSRRTGRKVRVPEAHLRIFPDVLSLTPSARARRRTRPPTPAPDSPVADGTPAAGDEEKE